MNDDAGGGGGDGGDGPHGGPPPPPPPRQLECGPLLSFASSLEDEQRVLAESDRRRRRRGHREPSPPPLRREEVMVRRTPELRLLRLAPSSGQDPGEEGDRRGGGAEPPPYAAVAITERSCSAQLLTTNTVSAPPPVPGPGVEGGGTGRPTRPRGRGIIAGGPPMALWRSHRRSAFVDRDDEEWDGDDGGGGEADDREDIDDEEDRAQMEEEEVLTCAEVLQDEVDRPEDGHVFAVVLGTSRGRVLSLVVRAAPCDVVANGVKDRRWRMTVISAGGGGGGNAGAVDAGVVGPAARDGDDDAGTYLQPLLRRPTVDDDYDGSGPPRDEGEEDHGAAGNEDAAPLGPAVDDEGSLATVEPRMQSRRPRRLRPAVDDFDPCGGVTSIEYYNELSGGGGIRRRSGTAAVWIAYGDGTLVRLPVEAFFPHRHRHLPTSKADAAPPASSTPAWVRLIPPPNRGHRFQNGQSSYSSGGGGAVTTAVVMPLPVGQPSMLTTSSASSLLDADETEGGTYEALSYGMETTSDTGNDPPPTLVFYTSDANLVDPEFLRYDDDDGRREENGYGTNSGGGIKEQLVGSAGALVRGVIGTAVGAIGWGGGGWGGGGGTVTGDVEPIEEEEDKEDPSAAAAKGRGRDGEDSCDAHIRDAVTGGPNDRRRMNRTDHRSSSSTTATSDSNSSWVDRLGLEPTRVFPTQSIVDPPRRITSVAVDPSGRLAAAADTLGRVSLVDLETKQIVRMWKGVRDAACHWMTMMTMMRGGRGRSGGARTVVPYLAIHAGQRGVVEVWRVRHGPRVCLRRVERGARVVTCRVGGSGGGDADDLDGQRQVWLVRCFIITPSPSGGSATAEPLEVDEATMHVDDSSSRDVHPPAKGISAATTTTPSTMTDVGATPSRPSPATTRPRPRRDRSGPGLHLQLLRQLLSAGEGDVDVDGDGSGGGRTATNVPTSLEAVYDALSGFESLSDLSEAVDLLATSTYPEERAGADGAEFHSRVIDLCEEKLDEAVDDDSGGDGSGGGGETSSFISPRAPLVDELRSKLQFHRQVVETYAIIHKFECESGSTTDDGDDDDDGRSAPRGTWAVEAMAWLDTYEAITGERVDAALRPRKTGTGGDRDHLLRFHTFAKACCRNEASDRRGTPSTMSTRSQQKVEIRLCDSTRDRVEVLVHLFQPLLGDIFVFKVVGSVFESLGISHRHSLLQTYFGEWFMALPAKEAAKASLFDMWCPILRWLQDMISIAFDEMEWDGETFSRDARLETLHAFCSDSDDLPRAFLLAVVCREAVYIATKQREAKTYGKVLTRDAVLPWDALLRKLRVCLLVSLRLHGSPLGPAPLTVANVESGDVFSPFEWVARDELSLSHRQEEIASIEVACRTSMQSFHPSMEEGDPASKWKLLQESCRAATRPRGERASRLFFSDDRQPGPLLLYLGGFNRTIELAAHRALLLGHEWGKNPESLHLIEDSVSALRVLEAERNSPSSSIAAAVRLEIWQSRIRPVYRALLFGFDDVPELTEEVMAPLCADLGWLRDLARIALEVLSLIERTPFMEDDQARDEGLGGVVSTPAHGAEDEPVGEDGGVDGWPPAKRDVTLTAFIRRSRPVQMSALEVHKGIIYAAHLTDDVHSLSLCVPSMGDVFLQSSLFNEMLAPSSWTEQQAVFLERALEKKACDTNGPIVDHFDLGEIENLGKTWGISSKLVRSKFVLALYRAGKDAVVDELASTNMLDVESFLGGGLEIACIRLDALMAKLKRIKQFRSIIGMLDADTCQWVKAEAEKGLKKKENEPLKSLGGRGGEGDVPSLSATHELVLKLLQMSSGVESKVLRERSHALSILSGTLLRAVAQQEASVM